MTEAEAISSSEERQVSWESFLFFDTYIRYYLHLNPDTLPDNQWAATINYLNELRKLEAQGNG